MTTKIKNILRGAGSVISISGASSVRSSTSSKLFFTPVEAALASDFRRISGDLSKSFDEIKAEGLARG